MILKYLVLVFFLCVSNKKLCLGSRNQLNYDGIVLNCDSLTCTQQHHHPEQARDLTTRIGRFLVSLISGSKHVQKDSIVMSNTQIYCHDIIDGVEHECMFHYRGNDMSSVRMSLGYSQHLSDLKKYVSSITITLTTADESSQNLLIETVPFVDELHEKIGIWSVKTLSYLGHENQRSPASDSKKSLESVVLAHPFAEKELMFSNMTLRISDSPIKHSVSIWQHSVLASNPVRTLFMDSTLRLLTRPYAYAASSSSSAHAEAFLHPILTAHPDSEHIGLISANPLAFLRELLRHRSLGHLEVIGTDYYALSAAREYMPELEDCRGLHRGNEYVSCIESVKYGDLIEWVDDSPTQWLDKKIKDMEEDEKGGSYPFDVIFVDVPLGASEDEIGWLKMEFQKKLRKLIKKEAVLVINHGNAPPVDDEDVLGNGDEINKGAMLRDDLLYYATRSTERKGLNYKNIVVYDEPLSSPFDSTFILLFSDTEDAYTRFLRRRPEPIDLDLAHRLHSPPQNYDGPTHISYTRPSRSWESWYCRNPKFGMNTTACNSFLPKLFNITHHAQHFKIHKDPVKGRSLVTLQNISKGDFILPPDIAHHLYIDSNDWNALEEFASRLSPSHLYSQFRDFVVAYGFQNENLGTTGWAVSMASSYAFMNHACGKDEENVHNLNEMNFNEEDGSHLGFSPVLLRRPDLTNTMVVATRDILQEEEILVDYKCFRDVIEDNPEYQKFLMEDLCHSGVGLISADM